MKTESQTSVLLELLDNKMLKNSMEKIIVIDAQERPQSKITAYQWHQEEENVTGNKRITSSTATSSLFPTRGGHGATGTDNGT